MVDNTVEVFGHVCTRARTKEEFLDLGYVGISYTTYKGYKVFGCVTPQYRISVLYEMSEILVNLTILSHLTILGSGSTIEEAEAFILDRFRKLSKVFNLATGRGQPLPSIDNEEIAAKVKGYMAEAIREVVEGAAKLDSLAKVMTQPIVDGKSPVIGLFSAKTERSTK